MTNQIEEIRFSETLNIWRTTYDISEQTEMLRICEKIMSDNPKVSTDGFPFYVNTIKTSEYFNVEPELVLDNVRNFSINSCVDLYRKKNIKYNVITTDCWVNVVRAKNPVQSNFSSKTNELEFHNHVDLNKKNQMPKPTYTFVFYIQMPNNLKNDDAVLFMEDIDGKVFSYLPKIGDLIIMDAGLPHVPNSAYDSTLDRIVLAGNVGFEYSKLEKSLI